MAKNNPKTSCAVALLLGCLIYKPRLIVNTFVLSIGGAAWPFTIMGVFEAFEENWKEL